MTKFSVLLVVPTLLFLTLSDSTVPSPMSQASAAADPPVLAQGRGNPRISLYNGRDLSRDADGARSLGASEAWLPLSLSSADFDNDGVPDLAAGYRLGNAGALVLWRGNEDAIHPNAPAAIRRRETGGLLESPFFASRVALETAESPDWLVAGDFDGDGNADLVFASRGSAALHVLPGNGAGGFRPPLQRDLPGAITAMAGGTLDPGSGGLGIAVAILGGRGASLLLLDSGFSGSFEALALPGPATGLTIARLGDGLRPDVVAVAGSELLMAHRGAGAGGPAGKARVDKARVERRSLPFWAAAVAAGHFGTGPREGLAFLAEDGRSWVLLPGEVPAPESVEEAAAVRPASRREAMAASPAPYLQSGSPAARPAAAMRVADLKDWALTETAGDAAQGSVSIRAARLSGSEADDLLVLDGRGRRIDVISPPPPEDAADRGGARSPSARRFSSSAALEVSGEPVALLPMRLNEDGVSDLVVLRSGSITPAVVLSAPALSLTVNSNGDTGDASPGNGICADSNGNCTLRAAIQEANASAGADTINFAISGAGVHTITTGSSLPTITGAVTIDGTTQSGYAGMPLIEVKGAAGQIGLTIRVSDCVVRGLAVNGYEASGQTGGVGIYIVSSGPLVKNALLEANFIGTDPAGTQSKPNHLGIDFENTSLHTVGGTTAAARNLISGNSLVGIQVIGPAASGNTFQGNYVGTTANGSAALPNAFAGFNLFANNTVVGGAAAGAGNVISGNGGGGLFTSQFCAPSCFGSGTVVTSNKVGTNPAGTAAVGNTAGVLTSSPGSPNTTIANNLISGNPNGGIQIDESLTGVTTITGNFIGTDVTGTLALGNGNNGGILIHTTVATAQINVGGATGTTAGGSCTGSCNLISANSPFGIYAFGSGPVSIVYNFIGTDVTGTVALGNDPVGVVLAAAGKTLGSSATTGNLISGNGNQFSGGAGVVSQSTASPGNTIKGNLIGTTTTGNAALGNLGDGVSLGAFDTLGGSAAADRNVISGNVDNGVVIAGASSVSSKVQGNFIGTKKNGTAALANGAEGVLITSASNNTVGGVNTGEGNVIAFNAFTGVWVESGTGNAVEGNSIFSNGALGIDLGAFGVDFNDLGDPDTGANNLQNYPNLASAVSGGGSTTITGSLNSKANTAYRLEFFSSPAADPTAHGEGQTLLGSKDVTTGNDGNISFTAIFAGALAPGAAVTATATSPTGDTSEFSCGAGLCQADVSIVKTDTPDPAEAGKEMTYTLTVSNAGPSEASGVEVTDPLPSTVNFVSADASQGTCGQANKTVTCDLGSIGNGAQATVTIVVVPTKIGKISNTATVTRTEPDPVSSNDSSKADTQVVPTKIVVNTTGDESDLDTSDDVCDVDAQTDGSQCTLRAAIQMSNAKADLQAIVFDIPGGANHTISPGSPLPAITDPVLLDATTQPGFSGLPVIELNGAAAGGNGLTLAAGDSTIKGLAINRFSGHGLLIQTKGNNVIQGNIIGTNAASAAGLGNGGDGISIDGQSGNTIGSLTPGGNAPEGTRPLAPSSFVLGLSNVIAGNSGRGISILSSLGIADLNKILTNAIGTDFAGKSGIGNLLEGVFLQSAIRTTIQNTVVASSGKCGIQAELKLAAAQQQLQQLNALMLDMNNSISGAFKSFNSALPREARPQSTEAIQSLFGGFASIFSGPTVPLGNLLGGLCMEEILSSLPNPATTVKILGSLFAANQGPGISATKTNAIQMLGSMVGTDETGAAGLGNTDGVKLVGSLNSLLGDPNFASSLLNVVAGNLGRGIAIQSQAGLISDLNKIFGTYVGTDFDGKTGLGNGQDGVQLTSALRTIVQGTVLAGNGKCGMSADLKLAEAQQQLQQVNGKLVEMINTVSGAHKKILSLVGQRARPASEKIAVNSLFGGIGGVFASGTNPLGNFLGGACLEQILTQLPNTSTVLVNLFGSLLAANSGPGVSATNVMGLQMQGSIVGTDENGGTGLGNTDGMLLTGLKNSVLGDPNFVANALNVVAGNSGRGVVIQSLSGLLSDVNKIIGTYVGTDLNGKTGLGNGQDGVQLMSALRTTVQGSVLAGNGKCGMSADLKLAEAQQQLQQLNVKVVEMVNTISGSHKKILSLLGQRARPASVDIGGGLFGGFTSVFGGPTTGQLGNALGGFCIEEILNSLANPQPTIDILGSMFAGNKGPGITATNVNIMKMAGSLIGTDEASAGGLGNTDGIFLKGVSKSVFGDTGLSPNLVNVVAGNSGRGFLVQSVSGLLSDLNKIVATYVGTDLNGKVGLGNGGDGIQLLSAIRTTIDATVMSGNGGCGVEANLTLPEAQAQMQQLTDQTLTIQRSIHGLFKQFVGNLGGGRSPGVMTQTDSRGIRIVGPTGFGGGLFGSTSKLLGNLGFGACLDQILKVGLGGDGLGNLFSGNQAGGILASLTSAFKAEGNWIGTDENGAALANKAAGMLLKGVNTGSIGGVAAGLGNVIAGNLGAGIDMQAFQGQFTQIITILNNLIGVTRGNATTVLKNLQGIRIENSQNNVVGSLGSGNIIAGNTSDGIVITGPSSTGNVVAGNFIGTDETSASLGNGGNGVLITAAAGNSLVGTSDVIAFNAAAGVEVDATAGCCNAVDPNTIFGNGGLGIDLGSPGPNPNDAADADSGPNNLQNFPDFVSARINGSGELVIAYKVDSAPANSNYGANGLLVEFFRADPGGEGRTFLGNDFYTAADYVNGLPGARQVNFGNAAAKGVSLGDTIVASATDASGNSSEFTSSGLGPGGAFTICSGSSSETIAATASVCASRKGNIASIPSSGPGSTYNWTIGNGTITAGAGTNTIIFTSGASGSVSLSVTASSGSGCGVQSGNLDLPITACAADPQGLAVDPTPDGAFSNGNGVLEPGETVRVRPSWKNLGGTPLALSGTASGLTGPPGATYTPNDSTANYGSIAAGATADCSATGDCYEFSVSDPATRPVTHWDARFNESLSDGDPATVRLLHIGDSFQDVPRSHVFYQFIERILHNGVTTGCTPSTYCPDAAVFRLQMAVFIARTQAGGDANVPVSGTAQGQPYNCVSGGTSLFSDVPPSNPFCRHVHYIYSTHVTTGCEPGKYCPDPDVTRAQMALFISRAFAGSDAAVPQTYGPDPVTGRSYSCNPASPNLHFTDITTSDIFCRATHFLWARDVISGFPDGSYGPTLAVTRGAMAKFLANGFKLVLYGP